MYEEPGSTNFKNPKPTKCPPAPILKPWLKSLCASIQYFIVTVNIDTNNNCENQF